MTAGAGPLVAVDTSVAVPRLIESHPDHALVRTALAGRAPCLTGQSHLETYAVLTRLPGDARLAPADAARLIDLVFSPAVQLPLERRPRVSRELSALGIGGGAAYDGLVALEAIEHGLSLVSRDRRASSTYSLVGVTVELLGTTA